MSLAVVVAATSLSALSALPGSPHAVASALGRYHAADLAAGRWWRLPTSALLAQGVPQWAWTVTVGLAVFAGLEVVVGSLRCGAVIAAGHLVPTLAVAGWAFAGDDRVLQHLPDFGTSCLIMAAAAALSWRSRSIAMLLGVLAVMAVDLSINGPLTVTEHVISMAVGIAMVTTTRDLRALRDAYRPLMRSWRRAADLVDSDLAWSRSQPVPALQQRRTYGR